ncbi:MAG: hypothetical protein ACUVX8_05950 [Candidatus Zipacnadales bacterium]
MALIGPSTDLFERRKARLLDREHIADLWGGGELADGPLLSATIPYEKGKPQGGY